MARQGARALGACCRVCATQWPGGVRLAARIRRDARAERVGEERDPGLGSRFARSVEESGVSRRTGGRVRIGGLRGEDLVVRLAFARVESVWVRVREWKETGAVCVESRMASGRGWYVLSRSLKLGFEEGKVYVCVWCVTEKRNFVVVGLWYRSGCRKVGVVVLIRCVWSGRGWGVSGRAVLRKPRGFLDGVRGLERCRERSARVGCVDGNRDRARGLGLAEEEAGCEMRMERAWMISGGRSVGCGGDVVGARECEGWWGRGVAGGVELVDVRECRWKRGTTYSQAPQRGQTDLSMPETDLQHGSMVSEDSEFELIAYSDADHAGCHDDCKSTSGVI
ncbi:hypothetical protein Tco_0876453 [Tanacetum coccineum]|uniref:Uncharacterized protein n=1 Tax=Tanacetum coccineum TaxID=301880 RepID=A0ABQ5BV59_9ASTR